MGTLEQTEKRVILRRAASQIEWVAHVLVGVDFPVHVLRGQALLERIRQIAARSSQILAKSDQREPSAGQFLYYNLPECTSFRGIRFSLFEKHLISVTSARQMDAS